MIKKFVIALLTIPFLIIFSYILLLIIYPVINNVEVSKFEKQFFDHSLPSETSVLESKSTVGKLNGNGNGLDFFACYLIKSSLSLRELKEYYDKEGFKNAKNGKYPVKTEVLQVTSDSVESKHLEHVTIRFDTLKNIEDFSGYFFITIYDGGYSAGFDIRGH